MVFSPWILMFVILTCIVATSEETQSVKKCCEIFIDLDLQELSALSKGTLDGLFGLA